jgi:hypothetical protein
VQNLLDSRQINLSILGERVISMYQQSCQGEQCQAGDRFPLVVGGYVQRFGGLEGAIWVEFSGSFQASFRKAHRQAFAQLLRFEPARILGR